MRKRADVVVVGAGIVGSAVAHYLTRAGIRNVVVVDQGPLGNTGGSSYHAPGLVFHANASRSLGMLAKRSTDLYRELNTDELPTWLEVGGIELATTPERLAECHRRRAYLEAIGIEASVLTPEECGAMEPLLDPGTVLGGLYVARDGLCKAINTCDVLLRQAESRGAEINELTEVTGFDIRDGRIRGVETSNGTIAATTVIACAGIWSKNLQALTGVPMPLQPMQHLMAYTVPLPELAGHTTEVEHPIMRHQDRSMYFKQRGDSYGIGAYRHEPLTIEPREFAREPDGHTTAQLPFTERDFADARDATNTMLPSLRDVELADRFNGHFSFTPDGYPMLGESSRVRGLWLAEGIWVTHAGGSAKAVVDLLTTGRSEIDLRQAHPDRFYEFATTDAYVRARGAQQYREVYDIIHPLQQMLHPRGLRTTPYHQRFEEAGAELIESAGWERAQWFETNSVLAAPEFTQHRSAWAARHWSPVIGREHAATRNGVGVFDLTPFAKVEVEGHGAADWLNRVCASEIDRPVGRILYTTVLDHAGGTVCDLTVTRLSEDRFLVITGGGSGPRDIAWLRYQLPEGGGVRMRDVTSSYAVIGVWGPQARKVLEKLTTADLSTEAFGYMAARQIEVGPVPALALRISYVGELGYELYVNTEHGRWLWDALFAAGEEFGVVPVGTAAFNSLRVEKGYRFAGVDMHTEYSPVEAGLGFTVNLSKSSFIGREAALRERESGPSRKLCCLVLDDPDAAPLGYEPLLAGDHAVGYVTSADFGYTIGKSIAYGYLPVGIADPGSRVDVRIFDRRVGATVTEEPLFDPRGERLRV